MPLSGGGAGAPPSGLTARLKRAATFAWRTAMRNLAATLGPLIDAYGRRIEALGRLMREMERVLKDSHADQEAAISMIRERLAKDSSLRRKDFDRMTAGTGLSGEAGPSLEETALGLEREGRELCGMLKRACREPEAAGTARFQALRGEILGRMVGLERGTLRRLRRVQLRQAELRAALERLTLKGDGIRIQDVRRAARDLRSRREAGETEQGGLLDDFDIAQREAVSGCAETRLWDLEEGAPWDDTTKGWPIRS